MKGSFQAYEARLARDLHHEIAPRVDLCRPVSLLSWWSSRKDDWQVTLAPEAKKLAAVSPQGRVLILDIQVSTFRAIRILSYGPPVFRRNVGESAERLRQSRTF